eukprot:TRINITY_DN4666_c0_g1_i1.p1 TRINITY_DN4666_c0_g1~~TRINITY_DN4666_c0_g1_i1.p1  ORF type:complete len:460 (-),score=113.44 TRINITY_DN4666_c0_g1_i1:16-1314(-)
MFGRKVAVDTHVFIYQFLAAVQVAEMQGGTVHLVDDFGQTTSHISGLFYRTIKLLKSGIKPIYVFDGEAPDLKADELDKRRERREKAQAVKELAEEEGDFETVSKMNKRSFRVSPEMIEEAKVLLRLMGVPVVEAPCEAEAQCVELVKSGKAWAVVSEDMDSLTLGAPIFVKNINEKKGQPPVQIEVEKVLEGLDMNMEQFIELCILLGTDFSSKIKGIGPKKAVQFIKEYGSIERMLKNIDTKKYIVPEEFPYDKIREYFANPPVHDSNTLDLKYKDIDEEALVQYMVSKKFNEERIRKKVSELMRYKNSNVQTRVTNFFIKAAPKPVKQEAKPKKSASKKENTVTASKKSVEPVSEPAKGRKKSAASMLGGNAKQSSFFNNRKSAAKRKREDDEPTKTATKKRRLIKSEPEEDSDSDYKPSPKKLKKENI